MCSRVISHFLLLEYCAATECFLIAVFRSRTCGVAAIEVNGNANSFLQIFRKIEYHFFLIKRLFVTSLATSSLLPSVCSLKRFAEFSSCTTS